MRAAVLLLLAAGVVYADDKPAPQEAPKDDPKPVFPGPTKDGFLLPNGWHLTPVGKHVEITDLPLNIHPLKDGKHALVTTNGFNQHNVYLIDLNDGKVVASERSRQSWFGLAVSADEGKLWWSGGGYGLLHTFDLKDGKFTRTSKAEPPVTPKK